MELLGTLPPVLLWQLLPKDSRGTFKTVCKAAMTLIDTNITLMAIRGDVRDDDKDTLRACLERLTSLAKLRVDKPSVMDTIAGATQGRVRSLFIEGSGISLNPADASAVRQACPSLTDLSVNNQARSYTNISAGSLRHLARCPIQSLTLKAEWSDPSRCYHALGSFRSLQSICLIVTKGAILEPLESWTSLRSLKACRIDISDTRNTPDTSILPLLQLSGLTALVVPIVSSGDGSALAPISRLSNLQCIDFGQKYNITAAAVEGFRSLEGLRSLGIGSILCDNSSSPWLLPDLHSLAVAPTSPQVLHRTLQALQTTSKLARLTDHSYLAGFTFNLRCTDQAACDAEAVALAGVTPHLPLSSL